MRPGALLVFVSALFVSSCGPGGTYCQSGAKMGTECHAMSDVRSPPGTRPPPAGETNFWNQSPQGTFGGPAVPSPVSIPSSGPIPMSSPAWRPAQTVVRDAGADAISAR
jgi:hypothetical protein